MLARGSGHIATVSSVAGKIGVPARTGYCAAKHALQGFFDALRAENAALGLKVTLITPGFIRTNIAKNALTGDGSKRGRSDSNIEGGMDPDKAAQVMLNGLARGKEEIPVGEGREMFALKLKRFAPNMLSRMTQKMSVDKDSEK
jgi:short-subunit dehydrogenase